MELIKYKFYLLRGQASSLAFGKIVNAAGEVASTYDEEFSVSNLITCDTAEDRLIQVSAFIKYNLLSIHKYDIDKNYIGVTNLSNTKYYVLPANVKYIRVAFYILRRPTDVYDTIYQGYLVEPHYKSLSKKYEKESNTQIFKESLNGTITLVGAPAKAIISEYSIEREFLLSIYRIDKDNPNGFNYYTGSFFRTDCKLDIYKEQAIISNLTWHHPVSLLLERQEDTVDILKKPIALSTISIEKRPYMQIYCSGSSTLANISAAGAYWEEQVSEPTIDAEELEAMRFYNNKWIGVARVTGAVFGHTIEGIYLAILDTRPNNINSLDIVYTQIDGAYTLSTKWVKKGDSMNWPEMEGYIKDANTGGVILECKNTTITNQQNWINVETSASTNIYVLGRGVSYTSDEQGYYYEDIWARIIHDNAGQGFKLDKNIDFADISTNYKRVSLANISANIEINTSISTEPSIFGKTTSGLYYQPIDSITKYYPIDKANWGDEYSVWINSSVVDEINNMNGLIVDYSMKDAYSLGAVINTLLKEITPNIVFKETAESSLFFYGSASYISGYSGFRLYLTQKTNILKGQYDAAAKKCELTFKGLMELLAETFKCYWFVDSNNILRIEHLSWFINGGSYSNSGSPIAYDLTKLNDAFNKVPINYFQGEVSYNKNVLPSRFEFSWADESTSLFKCDMIIRSRYVQRDKVDTISPEAAVDIDFMLASPNSFSNDGIAMLITPYNSNKVYKSEIPIRDELNRLLVPSIQNVMLSWLLLINTYMYDVPSKLFNITVKNSAPTAIKTARALQHTVTFIAPTDPNVYDIIKTSLGNGAISAISIDLTSQVATAELVYSI